MKTLRYTLSPDGPRDRALMPIITWLIRQCQKELDIQEGFADPSLNPSRETGLKDRIDYALKAFPCDILFVHRDAERESLDKRISEIQSAIAVEATTPYVPIIPIRMTEAWLLFSRHAILSAASNPNYSGNLELPRLSQLEEIHNPKIVLNELLCAAANLRNRRQKKRFERELHSRFYTVANQIDDFSALRQLSAFKRFEQDTRIAIKFWSSTQKDQH